MARVVVCDDDTLARGAITTVCEEAGLEVVAETDSGGHAAEMVRRFGVDVLVLDLSLNDGSGERTLETLAAQDTTAEVVVFTAYATDTAHLRRIGAREVVEKPDFELLGEVLARLATSVDTSALIDDRRIASREVAAAPKPWRSPAGVSSHHELAHALPEVQEGDSVVVVTIVGLEELEADVGPLLTADCRLAVAACLRDQLRIQDLLHEAPEVAGFIALVRGGDARAAGAVWSRLMTALRSSTCPGEVRGAASRVDALGTSSAVARAIGALQGVCVASPLFVIV
jgi:two-component system, chemotaxis family, chemotaxis protein CheY